jgi:hypothetical protein
MFQLCFNAGYDGGMHPEYCEINGQRIEGLSCTSGRYYATHARQLVGKPVWFGSDPDKALKKFLDWKATLPPTEPVKLTGYERLMLEQQYWRDLKEKVITGHRNARAKVDDCDWRSFLGIVQAVCQGNDDASADVLNAIAPRPRPSLDGDLLTPEPVPPINYETLSPEEKRLFDEISRAMDKANRSNP